MTSPSDAAAGATRPPLHEIAHLGHVELLTPEPDKSLWFFVEVLGLTESGREGNSVYLRTWDDYEHHTVKLTAHDTSGIRRVGLRAWPLLRRDEAELVAQVRQALGADRFDQPYAAGSRLSQQEAVAAVRDRRDS